MKEYIVRLYEIKYVEIDQYRISAPNKSIATVLARKIRKERHADTFKIDK